MKEKDILFEAGGYWVSRTGKQSYTCWASGLTHSVPDSTYSDDSLAIARAAYLAKYHPDSKARALKLAQTKSTEQRS